MAKSRNVKGKEPAIASVASHFSHDDNNNNNRLTRQAQAYYTANRGRKTLVPDSAYSSDEDRTKSEDESNYDNINDNDNVIDIDAVGGEHYPPQAEDEAMSEWEEELADEEASIQELRELIRAKQALLRQRNKAGTIVPSFGPRSNGTPVHAPTVPHAHAPVASPAQPLAAAPAHAHAAAPAAAPAPAPAAAAPTRTPLRALVAPAAAPVCVARTAPPPVHAVGVAPVLAPPPPPSRPPTPDNPQAPTPLFWEGAPNWVPLPPRKVDQTVKKIRAGLGCSDDHVGWLRGLAIIRNGITRCGLNTNKPWSRQDPVKVGFLLPILDSWMPGFTHFEDNWGALFLVQSKFNNRRGGELQRDRQAAKRKAAARRIAEQQLAANQAALDAPALQRFDTPGQMALEPEQFSEPEPIPRRAAHPASPRQASSSRQHNAVHIGVSADDLALAQTSIPPSHVPLPVHPPTPMANAPSSGPAPLEKAKGRPRPKMRPPPTNDTQPIPNTTLAPLPLHRHAKANTGISQVGLESQQHPLSGVDAPRAPQVLVPETPQSQAPTDDLTIDKPSALQPYTEQEPAPKKLRPRGPTASVARAETALNAVANPSTNTANPSTPGASDRRRGLRSGKAAAAAATELTAAVRQKEQSKKRVASLLKGPPSKKGKGKKQGTPPSSPPSEPLQPESEGASENDDGFHSPEED